MVRQHHMHYSWHSERSGILAAVQYTFYTPSVCLNFYPTHCCGPTKMRICRINVSTFYCWFSSNADSDNDVLYGRAVKLWDLFVNSCLIVWKSRYGVFPQSVVREFGAPRLNSYIPRCTRCLQTNNGFTVECTGQTNALMDLFFCSCCVVHSLQNCFSTRISQLILCVIGEAEGKVFNEENSFFFFFLAQFPVTEWRFLCYPLLSDLVKPIWPAGKGLKKIR